jgi:D-amino-acid oxidase
VRNANSKASVLVIGAGVNGLTTALKLLEQGVRVTVAADRFAPQVTSVVAGALWEWPPAVCGSHHDKTSLARSKVWSAISYPIFSSLASDPRTGVFLRPVTFYFKEKLEETSLELSKMEEFRDKVAQFSRDPAFIVKNGINPSLGLNDAYRFIAPMVDTDAYMPWLLDQIRMAGVKIVERHISGSLAEIELSLRKEYSADWIVNCSGLGARELACDDVYPLRGALVRLRNNIGLAEAHCVSHHNGDADPSFIFILPRGRDRILVGGLAEKNEWDLRLGLDHPSIRQMWSRCLEFLPALKHARLDEAEPVRAGLRPVRPHNVRLELEPNSRIIHNYGHGGSGVTFSWGCAAEIADLILN